MSSSSIRRKTSKRKTILKQAFHITNLQLHPINIFAESQIFTQGRYLIISSAYYYIHFKEISINTSIVISVYQQHQQQQHERKTIFNQEVHITNLQLHPIKIFVESQLLTRSRYLRISSSYHYLHFEQIPINISIVVDFQQQQQQKRAREKRFSSRQLISPTSNFIPSISLQSHNFLPGS